MIFIIEHMEPRLSKWCLLEYKHISKEVGRDNLWFTSVKRKNKQLESLGRVFKERAEDLGLANPCVLDPEAEKTLSPEDCRRFSHLIFGGILGNDPPERRTRELFSGKQVERRSLGSVQMSTDTAVIVANKICKGIPFEKLSFLDGIDIKMDEGESVYLPYRYMTESGKPILPDGLVGFLKKKKVF